MKRIVTLCLGLVLCSGVAPRCFGQMGMDLFKKPGIAKSFNPVVGKGALYETVTKKNSSKGNMELGVVGKDSVDGKEAYWMQFYTQDEKGQTVVGKSLITREDLEITRMIIQPPGQPAMEMPFKPGQGHENSLKESLNELHSLGTEMITVPAGTFSCEHWRNDKKNSDVWTSDKVTPFGMVKEVGPDSSMVLVKIVDVSDRITGPVKKFDLQQMMQQRQQQKQQQNP
ncbi:MAG TPA: hypothetical protein VGI13_02415 [Candidatus Acidoferrum sp.]|jgi:hypothetical protein